MSSSPAEKKYGETSAGIIELKDNGIVCLYTNENAEIGIEEIKEIYTLLSRITGNRPCYVMVFPGHGTTATREAREFAASIKQEKQIVAEAIVVNSLAIRIMANFFIKVNRPRQKVKLFTVEKDALEWLHEMRAEEERGRS